MVAPSLVMVVDDNVDNERSESNLGCFLGGGVASEASLSMEDLRFEPYKVGQNWQQKQATAMIKKYSGYN